ncbi:acyltransferase family protein [Spirosoma rigui]|uniref:acyltransferase family protein n=1 Tax=Spirosoma rigui TaxID=564064 RepID=UPI0009B05D5D|nr:acyltransferase [Spirosoma rigui]
MDHRSASVDAFRLLAACLVFFCHSIYTSQASLLTLLGLLGRWIIPFFFLVSGYYFQKSYTRQPRYAFSKIAKGLLAVTLFVNLFYLAFIGLVEGSLVTIANHFTLLVGTYFHLWFLTSMMLGYIVLWFLLTFGLERLMPNVAAVFLLLILSLAPYNTLFGLSPHPMYARSLLSIPFLCIGFLIARHALDTTVSTAVSWLLIGVGIGIQIAESRWLASHGSDPLKVNFLGGTLLLSAGMFLLSLQVSMANQNWLSYYGRRYSFSLYLYHPVVNYFLYEAYKTSTLGAIIYWMSPLLALATMLLLLIGVDKFAPPLFRILNGDFSQPRLVRKPG